MGTELDLEKVGAAYKSLEHFAKTNLESPDPGKFSEALKLSIEAGLFTNKELNASGVSPESISEAFAGNATGLEPAKRRAVLIVAITRAQSALGIRTPTNA